MTLTRWNADVAFWAQFKADGYLILNRLLGTLDTTTGMRAADGMMVQVSGARYQIRDLDNYHFLACSFQGFIAHALWAAAGLQSMQISVLDHDPSAVFVPEMGRWVYEDQTYNDEYLLDGLGEPLSPLDLLAISTAGESARLRPGKIIGPDFDPTIYNPDRKYMDAGHPEGMMIMGSVLWGRWVGTAGAWGARFVQVDVPAVHTAPYPWGDPNYYVRVAPEQAFPILAPVFTDVALLDSVGVVHLASTFPDHQLFQRRIGGGSWRDVGATDVLPLGTCRVEYRSLDRRGNVSGSSTLDVWLPRGGSFVEAHPELRGCT